jgi:CRISPR/Cas system-associated exonuclease Cas4 (RecB family)
MPKKWFICPDGEHIEIEACLQKCRMGSRCATRPYLRMAGEERPYSGHASVTMLERCTRMVWLSNRHDYAVDPDDSAFRILGIRVHEKLDDLANEKEESETFLDIDGIRGVTDLVEEDNGEYVLTDTKVVGSFAVAKMLGISKIATKPIYTEAGEPVMYVRGPKKGAQKTLDVYGPDPARADVSDYIRQPNLYRLQWNATHAPKKIDRLQIQAIVRDGGTITAKGRGVTRNKYIIPIPIMDEDELREWAVKERGRIEDFLSNDIIPPVGTDKETWNGRFCQGYCPVREICRNVGDNPWLKGGGEDDA